MAATIRQQIEDGVIAELEERIGRLKNPQSGYLTAIEPYNGEITDSDGPEDMRLALRGRSPVVLVTAAGAALTPESVTRRRYMRRITVELYAISNHLRSRPDRLRRDVVAAGDATADPGIYRIAEDVQQLLSGNDLGLAGVGPLSPAREDVLLQLKDFTVWRLVYVTDTDAHVAPWDSGDQLMSAYQIDGNLVDEDGETVLPSPPNPMAEADGDL